MSVPVRRSTEAALVAAMERLLANEPLTTDGRLTVANLAREALVSRATANRATGILETYREAIIGRKAKPPRSADGLTEPLGRRRAAHNRAQHIQARAMLKKYSNGGRLSCDDDSE